MAIIAFQIEDLVKAFDHFDKKNKERVGNIRDLIMGQKKNLEEVEKKMTSVKANVQKNEKFLNEFRTMRAKLD